MNPSTPSPYSTINDLAAISSSVSASVSRWFSTTFSDPRPRSSPTSSTFTSPAFSARSIVSDTSTAPSPTTFRPRAPNMAPCPPELYAMFPTIQVDLIQAVYLETGGNVDATVPRLLEMTDPDFAMRPRTPSPPPPPPPPSRRLPQPNRQRTTEHSRDFLAAHYAAFTPGVAMSGMMRSDMPTSSLGPITVQSLWDDAANANEDQEDRPFLPDLDMDITQVAAKTKTLLRDVATRLERFGSKVADEIEIALGDAPPAQAATAPTSSRNSFALSMHDDAEDDASIVTLTSMNPAHPLGGHTSRSASPASSPRVSHFAARAGAAPTGLTITTTRTVPGSHRRTNSSSSTASSVHSLSAPPSPFVVSEAGDSDDELDMDLDAAAVPSASSSSSSSSVSRSPPRASASSPTGPARTGSWPIPAARRLGSASSSVATQRPSSPLAGSVLSTSPAEHVVESPMFKAKGKAKAVAVAEAPVLIEE